MRPLQILHLEDDEADAELVQQALAAGGVDCTIHRVEGRADFERALEVMAFDLIFSDYGLPGFSGTEALRLARARAADTPFILVSGTIGEDAAITSFVSGANDFVSKHHLARLVPAVHRVLATMQALRAQREAEAARRASDTRYRRLFESSSDALLVLDRSGQVLDLNPAFLALFKLPDDVAGKAISDLLPSLDWGQVLTQGASRLVDQRVVRDGHAVVVDLVGRAWELDGQPVVQCSLRDVTEQRRLEAQLRVSLKLEAIGQLAGGVAHDFNNLLVVINSAAELASRRLGEGHEAQEELREILDAGQRAATLTRQLLAFGRRQVFNPQLLRVGAVVQELQKLLGRLIKEDIALTFSCRDESSVRADPAQLEQVVVNLIVNARDAMPRGGTLRIETRDLAIGEPTARLLGVKAGAWVELSVIDSGVGMSPEVSSHIFEPFFTTKPVGQGTGLGLATVYGIVKQSGGAITVESEEGAGTSVRIYFPNAPGVVSTATPPPVQAVRGTETILVAEDDPAIRRLLRRGLELAGYTVLLGENGSAALALARSTAQPIDLLITDVVMPSMRGDTLADELTRLRPGLRVLFISGHMGEDVFDSVKTRAFLSKPFTVSELQQRVREVLG